MLKTGIYANSLIIPGEDPAHLANLADEYFQRYRPAAPEQRDQVDILVRGTWTLRRLAAAEAQVWTYQLEGAYNPSPNAPLGQALQNCDRTLGRLQRIVNGTQRNYRDALHELERLQALPLDLQTSPETPAPDPEPTPVEATQPSETKPVNQSPQFVPSPSPPPPPAPPKTGQKPLPFHIPGSGCPYDPIDPRQFKRCPVCFPHDLLRRCPKMIPSEGGAGAFDVPASYRANVLTGIPSSLSLPHAEGHRVLVGQTGSNWLEAAASLVSSKP